MTESDRTVLLDRTRELWRRHAVDQQGLLDETCHLLAVDQLASLRVGRRRAVHPPRFEGFAGGTAAAGRCLWWQAPAHGDVPSEIFQLALRAVSFGQNAYAVRLLRLIDEDEQLGRPARRLLAQLDGKETRVRRGSEGDWR